MDSPRAHRPTQTSGPGTLHPLLAASFDQPSLFSGLWQNLRDTFFPDRLPPLELTSTPVPIHDRLALRTNPWAIGTAALANAALLAFLILFGLTATIRSHPPSAFSDPVNLKDFTLFAPPVNHPDPRPARGGGGGGSNSLTDPDAGRNPKQELAPIVSPQVAVLPKPTLPVDSSIAIPLQIKLPDNPTLPNIGVHVSPIVHLDSGGPGGPNGIGTGFHGGDGPGDGPGYGPGGNGGLGDHVYTAGTGGVTNPVPVFSPEAEFSDEARRNKYQGICMISIVVDSQGLPRNPRVVRSLGMGLDEKALEAVARYRFRPALKNGRPVAARILVEVNFRLY